MHTLLHSVPPILQQGTADLCLHQRILDTHRKSGSVSCGVTAPFSWVLVHTRFCLCLQGSVSLVLFKFWQPMVGLTATSSKRAYAIRRSAASRAPAVATGHCSPIPPQETHKHSKADLVQCLWGLWLLMLTRFCLSPPSISGGHAV